MTHTATWYHLHAAALGALIEPRPARPLRLEASSEPLPLKPTGLRAQWRLDAGRHRPELTWSLS